MTSPRGHLRSEFLLQVERKGDSASTDARARACADMRNFISHAAHVLHVLGLQSGNPLDPSNLVSVDEFAVNLGKCSPNVTKSKRPTTTPEAKREMRSSGKAVKTKNKCTSFQKKTSLAKITIVLAISPVMGVLAAVYAIRESDFKLRGLRKTESQLPPWTLKLSSMQVLQMH